MIVTRGPRTANVIRIGVMARELLAELRQTPMDQAGRARLRRRRPVVRDGTGRSRPIPNDPMPTCSPGADREG